MSSNYHFCALRPVEDLILSAEHKLSGRVAQYLRDFQLDGIRFLYKHFENNESCILNDESGLGKTATVCAFLETVLPHDATRNCLIIVKNDERVKNWKFHLEALTKLPNKVVFRNEDVSNGIVFLTKWDSFNKSASLAKHDFDCVIIDNRGELLANKICSGYLLRNYVNKISLIISSADVTIDLRQFHMMLKMCGRLGKTYQDFKIFEETFSLPSTSGASEDVNLLEAYFLRRERIINFCREFRQRRYRHQYDDVLPLVQPEDYIKSLNAWITTPTCYSNSSSSSVHILSSSSEKDAEQLLKSYFVVKEQKEADEAEGKLNKIARVSTGLSDYDDDMPPLLLESDSEEICADRFNRSRKTQPIAIEVDVQIKDANRKAESRTVRTTRSRKKLNAANISSVRTNMRSLHATRSKTQKNKYLLFGHNIESKKKGKIRKQITRSETIESDNTEKSRMRKQCMKTEAENVEIASYNKYSTRSRAKISCKVFDNLDKLNKKKGVRNKRLKGNNLVSRQKYPATNNNVKSSQIGKQQGITKGKKEFFEKKAECQKSNNTKNIFKILPKNTKGTIIRTCMKATDKPHCDIQKEVLFDPPEDDVIVLSSSTDNCTPLSTSNSMNAFQTAANLLSSPDIFSNVTDNCDILCSQGDKLHGSRFTTSSSFRKTETTILRNSNSSCLDLLEKEFSNEKRNRLQENERVLEISLEKNCTHLNEEMSEVTPVKGRLVTSQKNKITKYLIGSEPINQGKLLQLPQHEEHLEDNDKLEENVKTPKKPKMARRNLNTFHNSPKATAPKNITSNSLKTWLLKSQTTHENTVKPTKRRRLDLWFND